MITYRAEEVSSGICTCTLRGKAVEKKINEMAMQGWKFEESEPVIGRFCLFFSRYKMILVFSKDVENADQQ